MLIWHEPLHEAKDLAEWLQGHDAGISILTDLDLAEAALANDDTAQIALLVAPPSQILATALDQGKTTEDARELWVDTVTRILSFIRCQRRRVYLLDTGVVQARPESLANLFALPQDPGDPPPCALQPTDTVLLVLAEILLKQDPETNRLAEELTASAYDLSDGKELPRLNVPAALNAYQQHRKQEGRVAELEHDVSHARGTIELQTEQNQILVQEMEDLQTQCIRLEQRLKQVNSGIESYEVKTAALTKQIGQKTATLAQKDKNAAALRKQIEQKTAALAQKDKNAAALTKQVGQKDNKIAALNKRGQALREEITAMHVALDRVMNSRSVRITTPLRFVGDTLRRLRGAQR